MIMRVVQLYPQICSGCTILVDQYSPKSSWYCSNKTKTYLCKTKTYQDSRTKIKIKTWMNINNILIIMMMMSGWHISHNIFHERFATLVFHCCLVCTVAFSCIKLRIFPLLNIISHDNRRRHRYFVIIISKINGLLSKIVGP